MKEEFENIIRRRFAVRKYTDEVIEKEKLDKILEAGRVAPTAMNLQPFKIIVVQNEDNLKKIDLATNYRYGATTVLIVCGNLNEAYTRGSYSSYEMDACIVGTHMMLEATNLDVDTVWVKAFDADIISREFALPSELVPVFLLPLGYRASDCPENPKHNIRKSINELVEYR